jgi:hypothetical protein
MVCAQAAFSRGCRVEGAEWTLARLVVAVQNLSRASPSWLGWGRNPMPKRKNKVKRKRVES